MFFSRAKTPIQIREPDYTPNQPAQDRYRRRPGDVVIVTKLDRLGRSTRELLELIERIGKAGAAFRSLGDPLFDTTNSYGVNISMISRLS